MQYTKSFLKKLQTVCFRCNRHYTVIYDSCCDLRHSIKQHRIVLCGQVWKQNYGFRFSFRRTPDDDESIATEPRPNTADSTILRAPMPSPIPAATPMNVTKLRHSSASNATRKFLVDRPRSSTSIPGKTRFVRISFAMHLLVIEYKDKFVGSVIGVIF